MPWLAPKRWTAATRRAGLTDERRARWRAAPRRLDRGAPREAAHKRRRTLARWPAPRAGWTEERRGATKERRGATREASGQSGAGHRSVSTKGVDMAISRADVQHVARLARLALTDEELDRFQSQLSVILEEAEKVKRLP